MSAFWRELGRQAAARWRVPAAGLAAGGKWRAGKQSWALLLYWGCR